MDSGFRRNDEGAAGATKAACAPPPPYKPYRPNKPNEFDQPNERGPGPRTPMATLTRRKFTTKEYHRIAEVSILGEDDRVELIEGEIVEMAPIGSRHAAAVKRLLNQFVPLQVSKRLILSVQDPLHLGDHSEPQPDVALLRPRHDFYAPAHPGPDDVLLVVEVAESSAEYDRAVKAPLYAEAGVQELWIVDLATSRVEVHRSPRTGGYTALTLHEVGDQVSPLAFPDFVLDVDQIV